MRVIHSAGFYFPDSIGGTEVYVDSLATELQGHGVECVVAAPRSKADALHYLHNGVEVFRYPSPEHWRRRETQGKVPHQYFSVFEAWLRTQKADAYHQHSWTTGCGLWHLNAAKQLGLKTIVTVHVAGIVCKRGTMLHEGLSACDGEVLVQKCASCWLQSMGMPSIAAKCLAGLPQGLGPVAALPKIGPALAAAALAANHKRHLREMAASADRIVAVCDWLFDALLINGIPREKLVLNRQGVAAEVRSKIACEHRKARELCRLGFLGRWDPIKGLHVLVEAFMRVPKDLPLQLDICAVEAGPDSKRYRDQVERSAAGDPRIRILPPITSTDREAFFSNIDVLMVPSQLLETGPLVVLEAFAAGTPVIGSRLGGIQELVSDGLNGLLVSHDDVGAWTSTIIRFASNPILAGQLSEGIGQVRTMSDVAIEMAVLYRELSAMRANEL
jgi:glycosyltransferase involved in cell wall biosynthesis